MVGAALILGVWVTGGLITNDFVVAMWLTVAWMAVAALVCLVLAARSRSYRWPVLAGYAVAAAALGIYLGSSVLGDMTVHERVATAAAPAARRPAGNSENVRLLTAGFQSVRHPANGIATAIRLTDGRRVLTLTRFDVPSGPDLRLLLVAGPAATESQIDQYVDLGGLKGNVGNQQYEIPRRVDLRRYRTVVVWCRAFSVLFARAPLTR